MPNDQYEIGELLGRGGMGQVHAARHRSGRDVAVKRVRNTLSTDPLMVDRLADEARLLGTISHPNVVRALDHGTGPDGMPYLVMDRAHGTPLHQLITQHGPLPLERLATIAEQIFAGLTAIHGAHVIHADLKSHNVLVDEVDIVTIIDFGLARGLADAPEASGLIAGTPAYMAPEVIAGSPPTVAADVYSTATIIYEMLTGTTPFSGHISTILTRQLCETVEPPSRRAFDRVISPAIDRVLLRALDPTPAGRYATVQQFADAFRAAVAGRPGSIDPTVELTMDPTIDPTVEPAAADMFCDQPTTRRRPTPEPAAPTVRFVRPRHDAAPMPPLSRPPQATGPRPVVPPGSRPGQRASAAMPPPPPPQAFARPPRAATARPDARPDEAISASLAKAQRLIARRELTEAVQVLEAALGALPPSNDPDAPSPAEAWRIETVLAALYDTTGKQDRARRLAAIAYRHALQSGCRLAEERACALVERLASRSPRTSAPPRAGSRSDAPIDARFDARLDARTDPRIDPPQVRRPR